MVGSGTTDGVGRAVWLGEALRVPSATVRVDGLGVVGSYRLSWGVGTQHPTTQSPASLTTPVSTLQRLGSKLFSETCDARALPLVGSRSESVWKGRSRGGVVWGWNAAFQSL